MTIFQSVAGFTKVGLPGIWFYESPDMYVYELLIWVCGTRKSKHFSQNTTQCQFWWYQKNFIKNL